MIYKQVIYKLSDVWYTYKWCDDHYAYTSYIHMLFTVTKLHTLYIYKQLTEIIKYLARDIKVPG